MLDTAGDSNKGNFIDRASVGENKEQYIYSGYTIEQDIRRVICEQMYSRKELEHVSHVTLHNTHQRAINYCRKKFSDNISMFIAMKQKDKMVNGTTYQDKCSSFNIA